MEFKYILNEFKSNLDFVQTLIANAGSYKYTRVEYRTFDEGMCDACFFILPKTEVKNEFEAFIILCTIQLHFFEEWNLKETTSKHADSVLNLWLLPEVNSYEFITISSEQIHREIGGIIFSIRKLLFDITISEKKKKDPERWGVFLNNERITNETTLSDIKVDEIISGVSFDLEWDSIQIMYQTENDFVFFSWDTGA